MKGFLRVLLPLLLVPGFKSMSQISHATSAASESFLYYPVPDYPVLTIESDRMLRSLPAVVDNSGNSFFPAVESQVFATCQQFCSVHYAFAYEINRLRGLPANTPSTTYPAHYTYNFMSFDGWNGVSFFYSLDVLKKQGNPDVAHYGPDQEQGNLHWMSGYDNYLNAIQNRLEEVYRIPVNTLEGHLTLKNWLFDHMNGSPTGGVAIFSASSPYNFKPVPQGTPEAGKHVIVTWPAPAVHGMTITGYNDSVRYDMNGDGKYTNDTDINGDGIVDLKDWEIGAYRFANSYGINWADNGYCYVLYSAMAQDYNNGGVWDQSVYVLQPYSNYHPKITLKATITHNKRGKIALTAGVARGADAVVPDHILHFPVFNYQGWNHNMQGDDSSDEYKTLELGLDISSLLSYVQPGEPATWLLMVNEQDDDHSGTGVINSFSVIDYLNGLEHICPYTNKEISDNGLTYLSVSFAAAFEQVHIVTGNLPPLASGQNYNYQMQVAGGTGPYSWKLTQGYIKTSSQAVMPASGSQSLQPQSTVIPQVAVKLPFTFSFYGRECDSVYVNQFGFISFEPLQYPYPYAVEGKLMLSALKSISAGFNSNLEDAYVRECWYSDMGSYVEFLWKLEDYFTVYKVKISYAIRLYPDGTFEIIYGDFDSLPYFPLAFGVSDGSGSFSGLETIYRLSDFSGKAFRFYSDGNHLGATINKEGLLTVTHFEPGKIFNLSIAVADKYGIGDQRSFTLSDGPVLITDVNLGTDQRISYQEVGKVNLRLMNPLPDTLRNISVNLTIEDARILVTQNSLSLGALPPGDSISVSDAVSFTCQAFIPDDEGITYSIILGCEQGQWIQKGIIQTASPEVVYTGLVVDDGDNHLIDPGETADMVLYLKNQGSLDAGGIHLQLTSSSPFLSVLSPSEKDIPLLKISSSAAVCFTVACDRETPLEQDLQLSLFVSNAQGINSRFPVTLTAGRKQVTIINLSRNRNSADSLELHLQSMGVSYKTVDSVPHASNLSGVPAVFLLLGFYGTYYILNQEEGQQLHNYLTAGGSMYMEGYSTWRFNTPTPLHPLFSYHTENAIQYRYDTIITGGNPAFPDMKFRYIGLPPFAIFRIFPDGEATNLFTSTSNQKQVIQWCNAAGNYTTIGSLVEFGSLLPLNGYPGTQELLQSYLNFLGVNTSGIFPLFHTMNRDVCIHEPVQFADDSYPAITSWQWEFPGAEPATSTDQNPAVIYSTPGKYKVKLTVSNGSAANSVTRNDYITVMDCNSINTNDTTEILVWPNPANDYAWIDLKRPSYGTSEIIIYNLSGHEVASMYCNADAGRIKVPLKNLRGGIYLMKIRIQSITYMVKLVKP